MRTSPMNDGLLGPKLALGQPTPMNYRGMTAGASPQLFSPRRHPCFTLGRSAAGGGETSPSFHPFLRGPPPPHTPPPRRGLPPRPRARPPAPPCPTAPRASH